MDNSNSVRLHYLYQSDGDPNEPWISIIKDTELPSASVKRTHDESKKIATEELEITLD